MKKKFNLIVMFMAIALTSCNDDCNHIEKGDITDNNEYLSRFPWYIESVNEEVRFASTGTYYDKFCTQLVSGEIEGRYSTDKAFLKLSMTSKLLGQNIYKDYSIKNHSEYSFTTSSPSLGTDVYEAIVESYSLNVGQTQSIQFGKSHNVTQYSSTNERIAKVSSDGQITASGEKGTAYIKLVSGEGNVWVKIVVGTERYDLWFDYIQLIGCSYDEMKQILGAPDADFGDGIYAYVNMQGHHNYINHVEMKINQDTKKVEFVDLFFKEDVPSTEIVSYLNSRYYIDSETKYDTKNYTLFNSCSTRKNSKAVVIYSNNNSYVEFYDASEFIFDLWPDFTVEFGKTKDEILSVYGSDVLSLENDYALGVFFNFDKASQKMTSFTLILHVAAVMNKISFNEIKDYLSSKYVFNSEISNDTRYYYYDNNKRENSKIMVVLNIPNRMITYYDLVNYKNS